MAREAAVGSADLVDAWDRVDQRYLERLGGLGKGAYK